MKITRATNSKGWERLFGTFSLLLLLLGATGCVKEVHYRFTINPDGTCFSKQEIILDRGALEQYIAMRNRFKANGPAQSTKPSDEQLQKIVREKMEASFAGIPPLADFEYGIESLEVQEQTVSLLLSASAPDLEAMVSTTPYIWDELKHPKMTMGLNEDQQFTFELIPRPKKQFLQGWLEKSSASMSSMQVNFSFTMTMPGKIISSSLPEKEENRSWIAIKSWDEETVAQFHEFLRVGIQIVSETGGLQLPTASLDSDEIFSRALEERMNENSLAPTTETLIPITEAGPGFTAELLNSRTVRTHRFKEAEKLFGSDIFNYFTEDEQTIIAGRLYTPKQKFLIKADTLRILSAKDDHDRELPISSPSLQAPRVNSYLEPDKQHYYIGFSIPLVPPPIDSRAVEELQLEVIVTTYSEIKKKTIGIIEGEQKQLIDISTIIPGAMLKINKNDTKVQEGGNEEGLQGSLQLEITGPPEVSELNYGLTGVGGNFESRPQVKDRSTKDTITTQITELQYYCWDCTSSRTYPLRLAVHFPKGLKRERVTFTLTGIDLY